MGVGLWSLCSPWPCRVACRQAASPVVPARGNAWPAGRGAQHRRQPHRHLSLPLRLEYLQQKQSRATSELEKQVLEKQAREAEKEVQDIK